jgi:hypothetical protein
METSTNQAVQLRSLRFNRVAYIVLLTAGIIFLIFKDLNSAIIMLCTSPAFDPFNPAVPWGDRPLWQRVWTVAHLSVLLFLVVLTFIFKI